MLAESENARGVFHIASKDTRLLKEYVTEIRERRFGAIQANPERTFWLQPNVTKLEKIGFRTEVSFAEGIRRKMKEKESMEEKFRR